MIQDPPSGQFVEPVAKEVTQHQYLQSFLEEFLEQHPLMFNLIQRLLIEFLDRCSLKDLRVECFLEGLQFDRAKSFNES